MRGVVSLPHGWGHARPGTQQRIARAHPGISINDLTDDRSLDRLSGNAALNGLPVIVGLSPLTADERAARSDCEFKDRKSVVSGKSVSVRVDLGVRRIIK